MKLTTEEFKGQANSVEALEAKNRILNSQIDQQSEKVRALENALEQVSKIYQDQPKKIDEYQQSLNRAKQELIRLQREQKDTNKYLDEASNSFDKTAHSIDGFGKAVKEADDGKGKGLSGLVGSLGNLKNLLVGGAVVTGAKELGEALFEVVDGTKEYRQIMGGLEVSGEAAGYTAEQTAEAYRQLYGVLGDTQTAATTVANLQAIGLEQEDLAKIIEQTIGAWALYGDSIPIDGLAEAINETIKSGEVTGTFADVLNWAGTKEDEFNEKLQAATSTADRANIVMEEMAKQGLTNVAKGYRDVNSDIVAANESQMKWDESVAKLGETLSPAADALRSFGADAIGWVTERIQEAIVWVQGLIDWFGNLNKSSAKFQEDRMEQYGYEKYYTDDGLLRYRQTTGSLAAANTNETPAASASDVSRAAAEAAYYNNQSRANNHREYIGTAILQVDGREAGKALVPFIRDESLSNPDVESDLL